MLLTNRSNGMLFFKLHMPLMSQVCNNCLNDLIYYAEGESTVDFTHISLATHTYFCLDK